MKENVVLKKSSNIVTRELGGETILIPIFKTSTEANYIYTLNEAASAVWDMIDGKKTVAGIKKSILKRFDTTPDEAERKLQEVLKDLKAIKAVL